MSEEAPSSRRDALIALAAAGLIVATVAVTALAPAPATHAALSPEDDPSCAEWSDGCHVCQRLPDGPACSLPGIACTPGQFACLRHVSEK